MKLKNPLGKKIENDLDFDFRADMTKINTIEEFNMYLLNPFCNQAERIYYRGERKNSLTRPLLPSIYRKRSDLFYPNENIHFMNSKSLYDFYNNSTAFFDLYERIIGKVKCDEMYNFLAFSQHYFGISPFIDFSKSLYVALSFALKDRKEYEDDILIYTLSLKSKDDYTNSIETANKWINDYSVLLFKDTLKPELEKPLERLDEYRKIADAFRGHSLLEMNTPSAKLIDVPANDLLRYQQGVFLMLNDFSLLGKSYLTKKIRDEFCIKKWIINKDICPKLLDMLLSEQPYYAYKYITNLPLVAQDIMNKK